MSTKFEYQEVSSGTKVWALIAHLLLIFKLSYTYIIIIYWLRKQGIWLTVLL